jgi:integrase
MPRRSPDYIPAYRHHRPSNQGIVTLSGRDHYLGKYGSAESKVEYDRLIGEWLARGRQMPAGGDGLSINELILAFWRYAERHYRRPDGTPTTEQRDYQLSLRPLRERFGTLPAAEFGPLKLKALRQALIDAGLCRGVINQRIARIVRMFRWGVSEQLVGESVHRALATVRGLECGRSEARERSPVGPVRDCFIEPILPHVLPPIRGMILIQRWSGMRPGEVCAMRACDIDTSGSTWLYRPATHKTAYQGRARVIALGPKAQAVVREFMPLDVQGYLFDPRKAVEGWRAGRRKAGKATGRPSRRKRRGQEPRSLPRECYTTISYNQAIARGIQKADAAAREQAIADGMSPEDAAERVFVPHWHPHQLRHAHATEVRRKYGLEASQVCLGHANATVSQIYAQRDESLATRVAAEIG